MSLKDNYLKYIKKFGGHQYVINKNIKKSTIDSLMQGCDIGISKAYEIAQALGITVEELYTGEKKIQQNSPFAGNVMEPGEPYNREPAWEHLKTILETALNETLVNNREYGLTQEEWPFVKMLIEILRGANTSNAHAIRENLKAFHKTRNFADETPEVNHKKKLS